MALRSIALSELQKIGEGINRPEGVVVSRDGRVWASDADGAVAWIRPDNMLRRLGKAGGLPNGINIGLDEEIIIANFGLGAGVPGPLQRLDGATGEITSLCTSLEGKELVASNYPIVAADGAIYCTHSSWVNVTAETIDPNRTDGFVYRVDKKGQARKVATGLKFANGCCLDYKDKHLFVAQTMRANVLRFAILADGALGQGVPYGPSLGNIPSEILGPNITPRERTRLGHPDGIGFDQDGNLWVTLVSANRIVAITPNLHVRVVIDDPEGKIMRSPTNIAWGGPDLTDLYIGTVARDYVLKAKSPVPGMPLAHQR